MADTLQGFQGILFANPRANLKRLYQEFDADQSAATSFEPLLIATLSPFFYDPFIHTGDLDFGIRSDSKSFPDLGNEAFYFGTFRTGNDARFSYSLLFPS